MSTNTHQSIPPVSDVGANIALLEPFEQTNPILLCDADSGVPYREYQVIFRARRFDRFTFHRSVNGDAHRMGASRS